MRTNRRLVGPLAAAGMVALWGQSSLIRSIQRGMIDLGGATSATATVTAVSLLNSRLRFLSVDNNWNSGPQLQYEMPRLELTNETTITATRFAVGGLVARVNWELTEYAPGVLKAVQRGTISIGSGAATATATITGVDTAKTEMDFLGFSTDATTDESGWARVELTNGTTVTSTRRGTGAFTTILSFQAVERF